MSQQSGNRGGSGKKAAAKSAVGGGVVAGPGKDQGLLGQDVPGKEEARTLISLSEQLTPIFKQMEGLLTAHRDQLQDKNPELLEKALARVRNANNQALHAANRYLATGDQGFKSMAIHNLNAVLRAEAILSGVIAEILQADLFLTDADSSERMSQVTFPAPSWFIRMVPVLRQALKEKTGNDVQDADVITRSVRYCMVEVDTVSQHPVFSGHPEAVLRDPKIRPESMRPHQS